MPATDVLTNRYDNRRSGVNAQETALQPDAVAGLRRLFARTVDGDIYPQPLVVTGVEIAGVGVRDVVYVGTTHNSLYAFDATDPAANRPYWHLDQGFFGPPVPRADVYPPGFGDFAREIGITSTPVVDRATGTLYVVAKSKEDGQYVHRLHALDLATGAPRPHSPAVVGASVSGMSFERTSVLGETAIGGPALASLGDARLGLAWTGNEPAQRVNVATSVDGRGFDGKVVLGETAIDGPALAFGAGRAYLGWTGNEPARRLNVISSPDLSAWSFAPKVTLELSSPFGPALAYGAGRLLIAWADPAHRLHVMSSADGSTFADRVALDHFATAAPALAFLDGRLLLAWRGADDRVNILASPDGRTFAGQVTLDQRTVDRPGLGADDAVRLVWAGVDANRCINLVSAPPGSTAFDGQVTYDGAGHWGVDQAANRNCSAGGLTLATHRGRLAVAWTGTDDRRSVNVCWGLDLDPKRHLSRPGLLLQDGVLYLGFGSHGDQPPYHGWVLGYDAATLQRTAAFTSSPDTFGGGIWQSGAGLSGDGRHVYAVVGNAHNGGPDRGNAILQLDRASLRPTGMYADPRANELSDADLDLVTAAVLRPLPGGGHQVVAAGKEGVCYVLAATGDGLTLTEQFTAAESYHPPDKPNIHGSPVLWEAGPGLGVRMFLWSEWDHLRVYRLDGSRFTLVQRSELTLPPGMPGGFLTLTWDGADPATALVWASVPKANANQGTVRGRLLAFRATDVSTPLWDSDQRGATHWFAKFCPPTVANGRVYLATFADPGPQPVPNALEVYGIP
jgi:hypothetical protein